MLPLDVGKPVLDWVGRRGSIFNLLFQASRSQQNLLKSETQVILLTQRSQQLVTIVVDQKRQRFIEQEWGYLKSFFLEADTCWMLAVPKLRSGIWSMPFPSTHRYNSYSCKCPLLRSFVSTIMVSKPRSIKNNMEDNLDQGLGRTTCANLRNDFRFFGGNVCDVCMYLHVIYIYVCNILVCLCLFHAVKQHSKIDKMYRIILWAYWCMIQGIQLDYTYTKVVLYVYIYMCCVYLKICIWYTTIPKHAKYQAQKLLVECKTTPWRTDLIPSALQRHPTVHKFPLPESLPVREAKIKTVRINVSVILRWTNPSTCAFYFDRESNTNVRPGYTKLICNQLKSNLIWTYISWSIIEEDFRKPHHFTNWERCLNMFPFPRLLVILPCGLK